MRLLVTGSSGFIGTAFCEAYHRRYEIVGVDKIAPRERFRGIQYAVLELRNAGATADLVRKHEPDVIVHLAAQPQIDPSIRDPIGTYRDNVVATINLLEPAIAVQRCKGFVLMSTESVYGKVDKYPTPEYVPLLPKTPYGASKVAAEALVRQARGLRGTILRGTLVYGPRAPRNHVVTRFVLNALQGKPLRFPAGLRRHMHPTRDANYIGNVVEAMAQAIDAEAEGTFNIGGGEEMSMLDIAEAVVEAVGSGRVEFDPTFQYREGEIGHRAFVDNTKARETFGYAPRVGLRDGLRATADWLRANTQ